MIHILISRLGHKCFRQWPVAFLAPRLYRNQVVIPIMLWHLPTMTTECYTGQVWSPLRALTLRRHCADFNCLFSCPWSRNRTRCHSADTKFECKVLCTLRTSLLRFLCNISLIGLLRTLSSLTCWSTMVALSLYTHHAMLEFSDSFCFWIWVFEWDYGHDLYQLWDFEIM